MIDRGVAMARVGLNNCNCFAVRKAVRRLTQAYDAKLAPSGIRSTQFMILMALSRKEGLSVNELAKMMVMDRTTTGKNLQPLVRNGLLDIRISKVDRRSRDIVLTRKGAALLEVAQPLWREAHDEFQDTFGAGFSAGLRSMLDKVSDYGAVGSDR
jgi:DNA-binding MarR family transcriptional regulator